MDQDQLRKLRDVITSRVLGHWWCHHRESTWETVLHLRPAMNAVMRVHGRVVQELLPSRAELPISDGGLSVLRRHLLGAEGRLLVAACLAWLLTIGSEDEQLEVAWAVERLNTSAWTEDVHALLTEPLRLAAAINYGGMAVSNSPFDLPFPDEDSHWSDKYLYHLFHHDEDETWRDALKTAEGNPTRLAQLLRNDNSSARRDAAEALDAFSRQRSCRFFRRRWFFWAVVRCSSLTELG
jgi:hypothetical protein